LHSQDSGSDKSIARDTLQTLQASDKPVSVSLKFVNNGGFVNNGSGNLHYTHTGERLEPGHGAAGPEDGSFNENADEDAVEDPEEDLDEDSADDCDAADVAFHCSYSSFNKEQKWRLPSGRMVEDVLHETYDRNGSSSISTSIRNWVLDLSNPQIRALFSEADWAAINLEVPPLPDLDPLFTNSMTRFFGVHSDSRQPVTDDDSRKLQYVRRVFRLIHVLLPQQDSSASSF
jgi:hypothetical protein